MVTRLSRVLTAAASLALLLVYMFPLWRIELEAPQYPEGLGMRIWVNTVTGAQPNDLQNINGLNHYIGMKPIHPEAIPELQYMPLIVGALIVLGLATAVAGRRWLLYAWALAFITVAVAGLADFYAWLYDYGHNLDPHAAIQVPGMSYQPPLIGSRQILNFRAHSYPALGGWMAILAGTLAGIALTRELFRSRLAHSAGAEKLRSLLHRAGYAVPVILLLAAGCSHGPEPIVYGQDLCDHCQMVIMDERFGAELVTSKGRIYRFDAVECLAAYVLEHQPDAIHSMWVTDFDDPGQLIPLEAAFFVHSAAVQSPMGMNLLAFGKAVDTVSVQNRFRGEILDWDGVLALVRDRNDAHVGGDMMHGPAHHAEPAGPGRR
jgi:copper chaperone NosL